MQQHRHAHDQAVFLDRALHPAIAALGFEIRVGGDSLDHFSQKDRRLLPGIVPAVEASDGEQAADQLVQTFGFQVNAFKRAAGFHAGTLVSQGGGDVETGQRGPQLVGNVVQQPGSGR